MGLLASMWQPMRRTVAVAGAVSRSPLLKATGAASCVRAHSSLAQLEQAPTDDANKSISTATYMSEPTFIDASCAPADWDASHALVIPEVISEEEHDWLVDEILHAKDPSLASMRARPYEASHWDSVITNYKELQRPMEKWQDPRNVATLERIRTVLEGLVADATVPPGSPVEAWLPPHIIDLAADGFIDGHVDSVKFSGQFVAGLSLLSTRTMVLTPAREHYTSESDEAPGALASASSSSTSTTSPERSSESESPDAPASTDSSKRAGCVRLLLPPRSVYVLKHSARFAYEHSVPRTDTWTMPNGASSAEGGGAGGDKVGDSDNTTVVGSERRLSIMFRDDLPPPWMRNHQPFVRSGRIEA